jgi:cyclopropane fatty-acyl-phospholipid synthase-like methyltransferase
LTASGAHDLGSEQHVRQIGQVAIHHLEETGDAQFDGYEATLRDLFARPESELGDEIERILASEPGWLPVYHLSPQRRMVLAWADFAAGETVLEVGAGCGAVTGLLCERAGRVLANEKFATRGEVIARRYADRDNLTVLVGGLEAIALPEPVDTIVCIGVWEYAGVFLEGPAEERFVAPFARFLATLRTLVRPGGRLLLAIENKLGLEYLAGAEEDHLEHGPLAGIEGYPDYAGVRTFSRREIQALMAEAGFGAVTFRLAFPDYKLPAQVLHEDALARLAPAAAELGELIPWHRPRLPLINESLLARALLDEGVMASFANSFVLEVRA